MKQLQEIRESRVRSRDLRTMRTSYAINDFLKVNLPELQLQATSGPTVAGQMDAGTEGRIKVGEGQDNISVSRKTRRRLRHLEAR